MKKRLFLFASKQNKAKNDDFVSLLSNTKNWKQNEANEKILEAKQSGKFRLRNGSGFRYTLERNILFAKPAHPSVER